MTRCCRCGRPIILDVDIWITPSGNRMCGRRNRGHRPVEEEQ